jgi:hypothetical protein
MAGTAVYSVSSENTKRYVLLSITARSMAAIIMGRVRERIKAREPRAA